MSFLEISDNEDREPLRAKVEGELVIIRNFAVQHLKAATLFTKNCYEIERTNEGKQEDIRSYASGAIMSSVAGLEAYINELYISHDTPKSSKSPEISIREALLEGIEQERTVLDSKYSLRNFKKFIGKTSTLNKYKIALELLEKRKPNEEFPYFKNPGTLVTLRNTLVHFKPSRNEKYQEEEEGLQEALKDEFKMSPSFNSSVSVSNSDFAATNCMTSSCGEWAVKTCYQFIGTFSLHAGIPSLT